MYFGETKLVYREYQICAMGVYLIIETREMHLVVFSRTKVRAPVLQRKIISSPRAPYKATIAHRMSARERSKRIVKRQREDDNRARTRVYTTYTFRRAHTISEIAVKRCKKNYNSEGPRAEKPLLLDWQTADPDNGRFHSRIRENGLHG